jgi:hypothetical protein
MISKAIPLLFAAGILAGLGVRPAVNAPVVNAPEAGQSSTGAATNSAAQPRPGSYRGLGNFSGPRNEARSLPADPPAIPSPQTSPPKPGENTGKAGK